MTIKSVYHLLAFGVALLSIMASSQAQMTLISTNTVWRYLEDGSNQGTAWRSVGFNDTDVVEKFFCRVDVTEEFPFLVTKLSPYFDR